jgi:hypothetical protein
MPLRFILPLIAQKVSQKYNYGKGFL